MRCKRVISRVFVCMFLLLLAVGYSRAEEPGEPGKIIMDYIDRGLTILKDPALSGDGNLEQRKLKLWGEISPVFDFEEMCKRTLGRYWKDISDEKRKEFVTLFTTVLKDAYIGKTDSYAGEKIIYLREVQDEKRSKVQTNLILRTGKEVSVDFSLLFNNDKWVIYDVIIEGVSMVNNYRSQFNSFLIKSPFEELIKALREKVASK